MQFSMTPHDASDAPPPSRPKPGARWWSTPILPLLSADDFATLIDAASEAGAAIAPDHARTGTNALALTDATALQPAFGPSSFALHRTLLPHAAVVERPGLALDIDTPADLDHAIAAGMLMPAIASPI